MGLRRTTATNWCGKSLSASVRSQLFDDGATNFGALSTVDYGLLKDPPEPCQIADLGVDAGDLILRHIPHLTARLALGLAQGNQTSDGFDAESQLPRPANELQTLSVFRSVATVSALGSVRHGHDADTLIVAHGFEVHPSFAGQPSNRHPLSLHALDPVVATGCSLYHIGRSFP